MDLKQQTEGNFVTTLRDSARRSSCSTFNRHSVSALIPSQHGDKKGLKTLVLDLDETLIHSSFDPVPNPDYIIPV